MVSPEFKKMLGGREMDSDGFTYDYGKYNNYSCRARDKTRIKRCVRNDKRSVKQQEIKFERKAEDY